MIVIRVHRFWAGGTKTIRAKSLAIGIKKVKKIFAHDIEHNKKAGITGNHGNYTLIQSGKNIYEVRI